MAGRTDAFLKLSAAVSLLLAASSVGHYFAVYLPARDAKLDADRRIERANADLALQATEDRAKSEKKAAELKAALDRETIKANYDMCLGVARLNYDSTWALNCKAQSDKNRKGRADCVATAGSSKEMIAGCDRIYVQVDPANCTLPRAISGTIISDYDKARDRCLKESTAGLQ